MSITASAHDVKLTALPLGDGRIAHAPLAGHIFSCQPPNPNTQQGAHVAGPWIDSSKRQFDFTAKAMVDGAIEWPHRFSLQTEGQMRVVLGNDFPTHATGRFPIAKSDDAYAFDRNPNAIEAQNFRLELPLQPRIAAQPSCLPMGPIGFMLSGSVLFNALDIAGRDAVAHETQDRCQGHPELGGTYHYHSLSFCSETNQSRGQHSELMGYALDGFGIFGRYGEAGVSLSNADLDACHGHTHSIEWSGQTPPMYHYHATLEYPYTIGCFRGKPSHVQGFAPPKPTWVYGLVVAVALGVFVTLAWWVRRRHGIPQATNL